MEKLKAKLPQKWIQAIDEHAHMMKCSKSDWLNFMIKCGITVIAQEINYNKAGDEIGVGVCNSIKGAKLTLDVNDIGSVLYCTKIMSA